VTAFPSRLDPQSDALFAATLLDANVYSLNVPVPSQVARLAGDLARELPGARARRRGEHTLVCKRLGGGDADAYHRIEARGREALAGAAPFAVRVAGVDQFADAVRGPSPVVYLAVESPELERLHRELCEAFDPVADLEGDDYVPHVTIARGGSPDRARELCERELDPVEWTVTEVEFRDAERGQPVSTVSLPV
jgi:2'-5' RNA ligase